MRRSDFAPDCPGQLVSTTIREQKTDPLADPKLVETISYIPDPLPPAIDWDRLKVDLFDLYDATSSALAKLNGLHLRVGHAGSLLRTLWMREAKLSSEVEDIETTAEELVLAGAGRTLGVRESGKESWNYVKALEHGINSDLPFSTRVIREMHRHLLTGVRGEEKRPGELRDRNVFIGGRSRGPRSAWFVPMPPGDGLVQAMSDLERFVNEPSEEIPPLFVVALMHYQFETIHPFNDGNGRIGRVLISRSLVKEGLLEQPVVYMSAYIAAHKQEYVDLMLAISRQGGQAWRDWIAFVLQAIHTQANDAVWRSERLVALRDHYHDQLKASNSPARLFRVVDRLFSHPAINTAELVENESISRPTASADLRKLESLGILEEYTNRERDRDWVARDIIHVIEQDGPDDVRK